MFEFLSSNDDSKLEVNSKKGFAKDILRETAADMIKRLGRPMETIRKTDLQLSVTTQKYFKEWNDLDFEFASVKNKIKKNIEVREIKNKSSYENLAAGLEMTVDELKEKLQSRVEDAVGKSDFFIAVDDYVLMQILKDGRFKTQFETRTCSADLSTDERSLAEYQMFGTLKSLVTRRPIYGFISDNKNGVVNINGSDESGATREYGGIHVKLKRKNVINRTTVFFGDTLVDNMGYRFPPSLAAKPHFSCYSFQGVNESIKDFLKRGGHTSINWKYVEAQYHGGLSIDDIESIHVSRRNKVSQETIEKIIENVGKYQTVHSDNKIKIVVY